MVLPAVAIDIKNEGFLKCGEITAAIKVGKNVYAFSCTFCSAASCLPFSSFDNFVLHMEEQHCIEFTDKFGLMEEEFQEPEKDFFSLGEETNCAHATNICSCSPQEDSTEQKSKEVMLNSIDPLDDPTLSSEPNLSQKSEDENAEDELLISDCDNDSINDNIDCNADNSNSNRNSNESEGTSNSDMDTDVPDNETDTAVYEKYVTLAIIANYEKHRLLWDPNDPNTRNRLKRKEAFTTMVRNINKQMGMRLKVQTVRERVMRLRSKFRCALQTQKQLNASEPDNPPLWYFDKMTFLTDSIKCKLRKVTGIKALAKEEPALPLSGLNEAQNLELIEIYKSFPCLWDIQHIGYRFQNQQKDAMDEMLKAVKMKMNLDFSQDELQDKITSIRHAFTQEKRRKIQSENMKEEFKSLCKFYENISFLEEHVGPFKCPFCEGVFNGSDQYKVHIYKHDGSLPFICPICNHGFTESGNYKVHLRRHIGDYPYECKVCGKPEATSTDLKGHMRKHTGEKPYFCEICGGSFRTQNMFSKHMRRHQKQPTHQCSVCLKTFYERYALNEHMKTHLNVRDKVCNICGKAFTTSKYLRQHKQIHEEKKKYICKICGKDFAQYAGLSGHMKTHGTTISGAFVEDCR